MSTTNSIPGSYRFFFTIIDPLLCTGGILTTLFSPDMFLKSFFSDPKITAETRLSLDCNAGFFSAILVLQLYLLRARPNDLVVWKAVEAAALLTDIAFLGAFVRAAGEQGRLSLADWTLYEWSNNVILTVVAGIRTAFLLGAGLSGGKGKRS